MKPATLSTDMEFVCILMALSMLATFCAAIDMGLEYYDGATGTLIMVVGLMTLRTGKADIGFPMAIHILANGTAEV
jgi:hypothetical protein